MSAATALKGLLGLSALAAIPMSVAYIFTADHSTLKFGTLASSKIENRFKVFDERAQDSLPIAQRRHRAEKIRDAMASELASELV